MLYLHIRHHRPPKSLHYEAQQVCLSYMHAHAPEITNPFLSPPPLKRFFGIANGISLFAGISPEDVVYVTLPLYHTNGGILATGQMLFNGTTVALRSKFSASNFWPDCLKYQCTVSSWEESNWYDHCFTPFHPSTGQLLHW